MMYFFPHTKMNINVCKKTGGIIKFNHVVNKCLVFWILYSYIVSLKN